MIKQDIVARVSGKMGMTKVRAEEAVDCVIDALKNAMKEGERIELRGFGVFVVKPRKSGIGRNPRTGAPVSLPGRYAPYFKPGKNLRERLNRENESSPEAS